MIKKLLLNLTLGLLTTDTIECCGKHSKLHIEIIFSDQEFESLRKEIQTSCIRLQKKTNRKGC